MMIKGYKNVDYKELIERLKECQQKGKILYSEIAVFLGINDTQTITNAFNKSKQTVKDKVLTKIMECLKFDGFVVWINGERKYYVKF